uniref:Uncharacterized protein n=1 Tax=Candidatus Kentrum sp. LPFa TaxID=2126335 RepID=A0A450WDP2_9GAMM|nr:MAG: hypothetical protein BECKLPF1236A_GA0070988_101203 [Candidatus Kentron sp. LPFa]VFK30979.1 MAG: hypothetical protein BECKLPF1236C_GA0070990_101253 [Candidatus Kentron sp. LPFa]
MITGATALGFWAMNANSAAEDYARKLRVLKGDPKKIELGDLEKEIERAKARMADLRAEFDKGIYNGYWGAFAASPTGRTRRIGSDTGISPTS